MEPRYLIVSCSTRYEDDLSPVLAATHNDLAYIDALTGFDHQMLLFSTLKEFPRGTALREAEQEFTQERAVGA